MKFHLNELTEILLFCAALTILVFMEDQNRTHPQLWLWSSACFFLSRLMSRRRGVETWQNLTIQSLAFGTFAYTLSH
jgi:hypothetical protein